MTNRYMTTIGLPPLVMAIALGASSGFAGTFTVTTDTSALIGQPSGLFALDFQFVDGSGLGDANNIVTLSGFNFNGGGFTGSPTITGGASSGIGNIILTDTGFFNEVYQGFTPGSTLSFMVSMTDAVDPGSTPDEFSFGILDNTLSEIPTVGLGDAFVSVDIDSSNPGIYSFNSDLGRTTINIPAPVIDVLTVPDSALSTVLIAGIWTGVLFLGYRKRTVALASP
jgi:hypothetical protein